MDTGIGLVALIKPDGTCKFPLELWLTIFQLDDLEEEDMRHLTLVCRSFRSLAQPGKLVISPLSPRGYRGLYFQTTFYLRRFEERLEFITSSRVIALGVHFVGITTSAADRSDATSCDLEDAYSFIDKLIDAFRHFPDLTRIHTVGYIITGHLIRQIYRKSQLQFLGIIEHPNLDNGDTLERELRGIRVKPKLVAFSDTQYIIPFEHAEQVDRRDPPSKWWLPRLSPKRLDPSTSPMFTVLRPPSNGFTKENPKPS